MSAPNEKATSEATAWRRCTYAEIGDLTEDTDEARRLAGVIDAYVGQFAAPIVPPTANMLLGARCKCGKPLTGMLGTFTYGLAHGEGRCGACGHPARADHYVRDVDGSDLLTINRFPLLYYDTEPSDDPAADEVSA